MTMTDTDRALQYARDLYGLDEGRLLSAIAEGKAKLLESLPGGRKFWDVPCSDGGRSFRVNAIANTDSTRILMVYPPPFPGTEERIEPLRKAVAPMFRDAFGRMTARSAPTEKDFQKVFGPILQGIAEAVRPSFGGTPEGEMRIFLDRYVGSLARRWNAELDADAELARALREIAERACRF